MKQQYIDKIREACIKANPEIMELKFGCEVKVNSVIYKISPTKIKELTKLYGKCILEQEYQELEDGITIEYKDLIPNITEITISDGTNFIINKQNKIFKTYSLCSNVSYGEIYSVSCEEKKWGKLLDKRNTLFEDITWGNNYFIKDVLGRPIQLADVLLAVDKAYKGCVFITVSSNGFLKVNGLNKTEQPKWNLTKPLEDQSEETLKFISELLK